MLKLLHASDIHIGAKFSSFGEKAATQRQALLDAFAKIIDLAISEKVQLLLIAGDLFDSNFPSYQSVSFVKDQLKKLDNAGIRAVILPGTHDCLSRDSIFKRENFTGFIFDNPEETQKEFPELDLTIFGKPNLSNKSPDSPLASLKDAARDSKSKYKIAMAHGSVQIEGKAAPDDLPISFQDIADSGMDYVALGHWHGAQDFSSGKVKAWYAGSPEITYQEDKGGLGQGYALIVEIGQNGTNVSPIKITDKEIKEINFDLQMFEGNPRTQRAEQSSYDGREALYQEIEKLANPNMILSVSLSGFADAENLFSFQKIEEDFQNKFFYIKVKNNLSLRLEDIDSRNYPEELILGQFVRVMQDKISKASSDEEKSILKDALQIGIAELEGKNVI